jgi:hypothetical protein
MQHRFLFYKNRQYTDDFFIFNKKMRTFPL